MPAVAENVGKTIGNLHDVGNDSQANTKCGTENVCSSGARARAPACVCVFGAFRRFCVFG